MACDTTSCGTNALLVHVWQGGIDSAIDALKKVTEIKTSDYTANGTIAMIDISKELEEQLSLSDARLPEFQQSQHGRETQRI